MSNFICEKCGAEIIDTPNGYVTGCEHYPSKKTDAEYYEECGKAWALLRLLSR